LKPETILITVNPYVSTTPAMLVGDAVCRVAHPSGFGFSKGCGTQKRLSALRVSHPPHAFILIVSNMLVDRDKLTTNLYNIVSSVKDRVAALQAVAALLKSSGSYRWVGLYDVDRAAGIVTNVVWSG
jgi:hypothetical protein